MATKTKPATGEFIDREVSRALRRLRIPSLAALQRERRQFEERYLYDGGYEDVQESIVARLEAFELINGLEGDRCNTPLETIDEWVVPTENSKRIGVL
jgi:hypothetical protein